jgi:hydrogenase maturation protein HypF
MTTCVRQRIEVTGVVQGVGFRPFVHRLATSLGLTGIVGNDTTRVFIEVEGPAAHVDEFVARLAEERPPLAMIDSIAVTSIAATGPDSRANQFVIVPSRARSGPVTMMPPDVALCADCRTELYDPTDRRYRHPFITCTNCGPRLTIIRDLPYDRPNTTMAGFPMCSECAAEYDDPSDRRYHAQPIGCHECGPTVAFGLAGSADPNRRDERGASALSAAVELIRAGGIVAVKGLGGYHLACDATSEQAVSELRRRKRRGNKPFAVMVSDLAVARRLAHVSAAEAACLTSPPNPIVLLTSRRQVATDVAPGNPMLGVLLPTTGLHHLLLDALAERGVPALVMTSGNLSGEPIVHDDGEARGRLGSIADAWLVHDRPIHVACDDSVVRVVDDEVVPLRRSRGYAPMPVALGVEHPGLLAVGGELKNTFCLVRGANAWLSQHIGDMENLETVQHFDTAVERYSAIGGVTPQTVATDAHPDYATTRWAHRWIRHRPTTELISIQHHHAHVVSLMAEHRLPYDQPILGVAFDGVGYGADHTIWGGELLVCTATEADRAGALRPVPLPGGDAAARHPNRVALAHLWASGLDWSDDIPGVAATPVEELAMLQRQLDSGFRCIESTSMGRLFDAVSSLLGICHTAGYEAQAAIELEGVAAQWTGRYPGYDFEVRDAAGDRLQLDPTTLFTAMLADLRVGTPVAAIAAGFHLAVARAVADAAVALRDGGGPTTVGLTGGVFQNGLLLSLTRRQLSDSGFDVRTHRRVPANDGGLALGQAVIAACRSTVGQLLPKG